MEKEKKKRKQNQMELEKEQQESPRETSEEKPHLHLEKEKKEKEIKELKKKLEEKEKEVKENYDRLLRVAADFDNYKKRIIKEKEEWTKFANEDLMKAVLPLIDNLERATNHSKKLEDVQTLVEGVKLTLQQLLQTLNKFGLSSIESLGKPFDPAFHEALYAIETDQQQPNQVMEEFQKGYLLNDRLLRPATVSVSKLPKEEEGKETE
jgi:molecular chaperone GrpE